MTPDLWGVELPDQLAATPYPFADGSSLATKTGLTLPAGAIVDASLRPAGAGPGYGLRSIEAAATSCTLYFGSKSTPKAAWTTFDPATPPGWSPVLDSDGRDAGALGLDPAVAVALRAWPLGTHAFVDGAAEFVAGVLAPAPPGGLRALGTTQGDVLSGDVWLIGADGVVLTGDAEAGTIRVDVTGEPLFRRRSCLAAGAFTPPKFILSINGIKPDGKGAFLLAPITTTLPSTALRIAPGGDSDLVVSIAGPTS